MLKKVYDLRKCYDERLELEIFNDDVSEVVMREQVVQLRKVQLIFHQKKISHL